MSLGDSIERFRYFVEQATLLHPRPAFIQKQSILPREKGLTPICVITKEGEFLFMLDPSTVRGNG